MLHRKLTPAEVAEARALLIADIIITTKMPGTSSLATILRTRYHFLAQKIWPDAKARDYDTQTKRAILDLARKIVAAGL